VPGTDPTAPIFFGTPAAWRAWLAKHHARAPVLWVGFHRVDSGRPSITWPQSVDEALCFGWIDGLRRSRDATSYVIRFTPRRATSTWSAVNIRRMAELERDGRVRPGGRRAFEARSENRPGTYTYERRPRSLPAACEKPLRASRAAWSYWQAAAPSYRSAVAWWIVSAKREETRARRLRQLVERCAAGRQVPPFVPRIAPHARAAPAKRKRP
jgi:uncharacterized protein YdeI (YjbR/CyaY-like superfamily)